MVNMGRRTAGIVAVTVALVGMAACSSTEDTGGPTSSPTSDPASTLQGVLTLGSDAIGSWFEGEPCAGGGGYDDLAGGAPVVVRDATGTTVAQGELGPGELRILPQPAGTSFMVGRKAECDLPFRLTVPATSDFYEVTIGNRPAMPLTADELGSPVNLTIG